jgi:hypothetical protein
MANKQSRINQLIFGDTGITTDFGQIGSESAGTPVTTKNLDTIQALAEYQGGLASIVDSGLQLPRLEDQNSLFLLITTQLRYLLQNGIPEWIATAQYFALVSFVQVNGVMYQALTGTDGTPNVNHNPVGDATNWQYADQALREMAFRCTYLGLPAFDPTDLYTGIKLDIAMSHKAGDLIESAIDEAAVAWSAAQSTAHPAYPEYNPIVKLWDADHVLAQANYSLLFAKLYAVKCQSYSGSAYVTDHSVTVAGSLVTGSGTAWDAQLAAIVEDAVVQGGYTSYRGADINGTTYAIASVDTLNHRFTVTGSPTTGAQTCIFYANRIAGSTTTVRTYKDSGRVLMSPDGTLRINGMRRRFHMQGHLHNVGNSAGGLIGAGSDRYGWAANPNTYASGSAITDGPNGTPIIGPETEPNSTTAFRAMWAGALL